MENIFNDINQTIPTEILYLEKPYRISDDRRKQFIDIQRNYRRSKTLNNRLGLLVNMYFAGELLDSLEHDKFRRLRTLWTQYYIRITRRTFLIFNSIRIEQLYQTQSLTLKIVYDLKSEEVSTLISRTKLFLTTFETEVGRELLQNLSSPTAPISFNDLQLSEIDDVIIPQ